jgi:hypothetical protein
MDSSSPNERSAFDSTMRHRTPGRDVMGKLDSSIPEVRVPHKARVDGEARAAELGLDLTAFIREIFYEAVYGAAHVARMYELRMLRASGKAGQSADEPVRGPVDLPVRGPVDIDVRRQA